MQRQLLFLLLVILLTAFVPPTAFSDENVRLRTELLRNIDATQQQIEEGLLTQNSLERLLRTIEKKRVHNAAELQRTETQLEASKETLQKIEQKFQQTSRYSQKLEEQLAEIIRINQHRTAYSPLRILFEVSDKRSWNRHLSYLRYITSAQWQLVAKARKISDDLSSLVIQQNQVRQRITKQREALQQQQQQLEQLSVERNDALRNIKVEVTGAQERLSNYQNLSQRLEKLAVSIGDLQLDELALGASFSELQGKLPLPVSKPDNIDTSKEQGLSITTAYGKEVYAIATGQVVYVNWISGLGLVVILDHGDEYLSLYAHNQRVTAKVGEWMQSGQVISFVGDSGGNNQPMLWLQLLHKGKPLDPTKWLALG